MECDFQAGLQSKLENYDCPEDLFTDTLWDQLKSAILQTSEEFLGFTPRTKTSSTRTTKKFGHS